MTGKWPFKIARKPDGAGLKYVTCRLCGASIGHVHRLGSGWYGVAFGAPTLRPQATATDMADIIHDHHHCKERAT